MTNVEICRLLESVTGAIEKNIVPEISSDSNKVTLDLCIRVINYIASELRYGSDARGDYIEAIASLLGIRDELDKALPKRISALLQKSQSGGQAEASEAISQLEAIVRLREKYYETLDPDIGSGSQVVYKGGRIARDEVSQPKEGAACEINADALTDYFCSSKVFKDIERAEDVLLLAGGFSKITALFSVLEKDGQRKRLAMRKDLKVPLMGASVVDEYPLLAGLYERGFPVPRPYGLEKDEAWFDGAFVLSDAVEGTVDVADWATDPGRINAVLVDLASWLAKLHSYDIAHIYNNEVGDRPVSAGEAMQALIAHWKELYYRRADDNYPLLDLSLAWLENNVPAQLFERRACIVHGDLGFHNLIVGLDKVAAVLDWEFAHLGDPVEDLAYLKPFIDSVSGWQIFLDTYIENGGVPFSEDEANFYKVWSFTRNPIGTLDAKWIFNEKMPEEIKLAVAGNIFRPYLELDAAKLILHIIKCSSPNLS